MILQKGVVIRVHNYLPVLVDLLASFSGSIQCTPFTLCLLYIAGVRNVDNPSCLILEIFV